MTNPVSKRTTVRRGAERGVYDRETINTILDTALISHVGVVTPDGPLVLPMAFGRDETHVYLHGALANHLLANGAGTEVCVTVTHVDGLVMARTPFHNSMNYRSVVIRGAAEKITDPSDKAAALKIITDHVVENWDHTRPASSEDLRATAVIKVPLNEASAKIRGGDPIDTPEDMAGPWWAGVIPVELKLGEPTRAADCDAADVPTAYTAAAQRRITPPSPPVL